MNWWKAILQGLGIIRDLTRGKRKTPKPRFLPKSEDKPMVPRDGR